MNLIKLSQQFITGTSKSFYLHLFVKPKCKQEQLEFKTDYIIIKTKAQPIDNLANEDVLRILCQNLQINESNIKLVKGQKFKQKIVLIQNEQDVYMKLKNIS